MLNPFDFAQAKLREASRSMNQSVLLAINEILRHFVPQNDIGQEPVISSKARNPSDAAHKESLLRYMQFTVIGTPSILCEQSGFTPTPAVASSASGCIINLLSTGGTWVPNALLYLITVLIWGSTWLAIKFQLGIVARDSRSSSTGSWPCKASSSSR